MAPEVPAVAASTALKSTGEAEEGTSIPSNIWRIHGRDYDLTSFVDKHPGGSLMILLGKGTDCTMLFETYHVINEPRKRLATHDVTPDGQKPPVIDGRSVSPFMADCREMIREHFKDKPKGAHKSSWFRSVLLLIAWLGEGAAIWWWIVERSLAGGALAGALGYLVMVNLAHDASHGAFSRRRHINTFMHFVGAAPFVTGQATWWMQHVVSHHQHTNEFGLDVDAHHFPFVRWHREAAAEMCGGRHCAGVHNLAWHFLTYMASTLSMSVIHPAHFFFQPLFAMWCCGGVPKSYLGGLETATPPRHYLGCFPPPKFDSAYEKVAGNFAVQRLASYSVLVLLGNVLIWCASVAALLMPFLYLGDDDPSSPLTWITSMMLAFVPFFVSSMCFMMITQVSHIQQGCQAPQVLATRDPYQRQAMTSLDYSPSSWLVGFLTGSLNVQSIHHTLPSISLVHYRDLYPKFVAICKKHHCEPQAASGLPDAFGKHLSYVYHLGVGDERNSGDTDTLDGSSDGDEPVQQLSQTAAAEGYPSAGDKPSEVGHAGGLEELPEAPEA